ncbi:MAG: type II toxin-antitoxin system VapC family toxin [Steroidobacteraceae bacterium]
MILLDTNVICEPLKLNGDPAVAAWIDAQVLETLYLSTISVAELRYGIAALPDGKRKRVLRANMDQRVLPLFRSRILSFDLEAAEACAVLQARARAEGKAIGTADSYIAGIAVARGCIVATRDIQPFRAAGVPVINPWEAQ